MWSDNKTLSILVDRIPLGDVYMVNILKEIMDPLYLKYSVTLIILNIL